jgi:WD40 repeat protein
MSRWAGVFSKRRPDAVGELSMKKSKNHPFTAFCIAFALSVSAWPVSKATSDDPASLAAQRAAEQKFDQTIFDRRRDRDLGDVQLRLSQVLFGAHADVLATVDSAGHATVLSLLDDKKLEIAAGLSQFGVILSPDGKSLVTAGSDMKACLWSTASGERIREFAVNPHKGGLTPAFSPDGKLLAIGNRNSTTALFEVATGKLLHTLREAMSHELRFDPSGKTLAIVYVDGQLILWDVKTGMVNKKTQAWANELYTVDWTPDGSMLVTGGYNSPLTFWKSTNLAIVAEFESPEWIMSARFSPDGTKLIFSGQNRPPENRYVEMWAVP